MKLALPFMGLVFVGCATGTLEDSQTTEDAGAADHASFEKTDGSAPHVAVDAGNKIDDAGVTTPEMDASSGTACSGSGTLVTYDFSSEPGNQTSTLAASSMSGVTVSAITRASAITAVAGTGSMNASNWSMSGIDTTRYFTFSITPSGACSLDITSIAIDTKASSTGPASVAIATSDDSFATKTSVTVNTSVTAKLSVSGSTKALEVRVYGFDATGTAGTMRIDNTLTVTGALN
jgi:hypothetical protein